MYLNCVKVLNVAEKNTEDGCGCLQPKKIKKEGMSSLFAEWANTSEEDETEKLTIKPLTPEIVLKNL